MRPLILVLLLAACGAEETPTTAPSLVKAAQTSNSSDPKDGKDGETGPAGPKGEKGDKGDKGDTGNDGLAGAKGDQGDAGVNGSDGTNGINGADGIDGTNGTSGTNGTNGSNGASGTNGTNGTNGSSGFSIASATRAATVGECPNGGTVLSVCLDVDSSGTCTVADTDNRTVAACNGSNGSNANAYTTTTFNIDTSLTTCTRVMLNPMSDGYDVYVHSLAPGRLTRRPVGQNQADPPHVLCSGTDFVEIESYETARYGFDAEVTVVLTPAYSKYYITEY